MSLSATGLTASSFSAFKCVDNKPNTLVVIKSTNDNSLFSTDQLIVEETKIESILTALN